MKAINTSNRMWISRNLIAMCVIFMNQHLFSDGKTETKPKILNITHL